MKSKEQMLQDVSEFWGGVTINLTDGQVNSVINLLTNEVAEMKNHLPKIEEMGGGYLHIFKNNIQFYTEVKDELRKALDVYYENY
jgi:hypothetical protein